MTYATAIQFLYDLQLFGLKLGLENTRRLAELAGSPQEGLRFVHVAGTNGKGSTCAMLESIYRAAGLRVGLFTSPHLVRFGERIQVNRESLGEAGVIRRVEEVRSVLRHFPQDHSPTFFEVVTVMALRHFAEARCDVVIWETGMGGRLDATNIVMPLASVITNIGLDHERWLGDTLGKIAAEKAGIIKPGVPALTAATAPEALGVLRAAAALAGSSLQEVTEADAARPPLNGLALPLLGAHQRLNAALAWATVQTLERELPVDLAARIRGLTTVRWPGRLQVVHGPEIGQVNLLDGAHNPAGIESLVAALGEYFPKQAPATIVGVLNDKNWPAMCRALGPLASSLRLVPVSSARSAAPEELRAACETARPGACPVVCGSLREALEETRAARFRLITGSLYLVGEALDLLEAQAPAERPERELNDWQAAAVGADAPERRR
ncbi:MAG: bifunctional folylpolyglutamate synthase/dihydrofolate synthase [Verrucomicrobia bacterium]|nr:bifunctional folylpolyglutamate synthase/dihydrofolate synthase [Verrucomicrobiota bacterium]